MSLSHATPAILSPHSGQKNRKPQIRPGLSAPKVLGLAAACWVMTQVLSASTITFSSNPDYDTNFYEPTAYSTLARNSFNNSLSSTGNSVAIYNTHATGGSGGNGGTAAGTPLDKFANFTMQADIASSSILNTASSVGFYTKVNDSLTSGYTVIFNLESATKASMRLFDSDGNPASVGVGTQIGSTQYFTTGGTFSIKQFFTFKLDVTDVGGNVSFSGSMFNVGGSQIGSTLTMTDTTSAVTGLGQVGLRMYGYDWVDNFSVVAAIPEPGSVALLAAGGALFLAGICRRRRIR